MQKYVSGPRFNLHMDRTVQPTKPTPTTPAFTSADASSGKAFGQTSNVVNQAAHTELSIESTRGDQNLSQPSVRAHWASQMSHTDGDEVGLTDEDFDTDPGDPLVSWSGEGAVSGFANHNPNKTLAILPTKPSDLHYDQRCFQAYDQPYNQPSDGQTVQ